MKQQSATEFQARNPRRLWTVLGCLTMLVLIFLMMSSYFVAMMASGGGTPLMQQARLVGECARDHMMPLAAAAERYYRDKGEYPERIEEVFPVYLDGKDALHCPADAKKDAPVSFTYHRPLQHLPRGPLLECAHHHPVVLQVRSRRRPNANRVEWEVHFQRAPEP